MAETTCPSLLADSSGGSSKPACGVRLLIGILMAQDLSDLAIVGTILFIFISGYALFIAVADRLRK